MAVRTLNVLFVLLLGAQIPAEDAVDFICPMDKEVRSKVPGKCPRCGMKLVAGIPDPVEYPLKLSLTPRNFRPGQDVDLKFEMSDPKSGTAVREFQTVHEKLFHLFLIGQDLDFFEHVHPTLATDGSFHLRTQFPKAGRYRILCDIYPEGGTPQLIAKTIFTPGYRPAATPLRAALKPDAGPKSGENLEAELVMEPPQPIAGKITLLFLKLKPADGLEQYLGAWGHMLVASDDLVDLIHTHPFLADGGAQVQFNVLFPREAMYRVWVQFQRKGRVNTVAFTVPVTNLK